MDLNDSNRINLSGLFLLSAPASDLFKENCVSSSFLASDSEGDSNVTQKHLDIHQLFGSSPFGFKSTLGTRYRGAVSITGQRLTSSP